MSSYQQIHYQIVFSTKYRRATLSAPHSQSLYQYIGGVARNCKAQLLRVNGIEDHIHIFSSLPPVLSLADYVKTVKVSSSIWMKESGLFPLFEGWQEGYGAFTYSVEHANRIIEYIKNQREHHKSESFEDEYRRLLKENNVIYDERYLFERPPMG